MRASLAAAAAALSLVSACASASEDKLLAFIGQKISVTEQPQPPCDNCWIMNTRFLATYRILETVHGNYRGSTITFDVFDHYGVPGFSKFDTVLLYVREQADGSWRHEKYQFDDLYKGVDDEWYGCGDPYARYPDVKRTARTRPVQFQQPVSYPIDKLLPDFVKLRYPTDYFDIRDGRAICKLGTPAADLFRAKMETILAPRPTP